MIPTLEDIIRALAAGRMSSTEALSLLAQHEAMNEERVAEDRKVFAAMAMQGALGGAPGSHLQPQQLARESVAHADALLAELAR